MVIGLVVLVSTAASTLALGLLVDSNAPFDHAFAAQHGSEVTATAKASHRPAGRHRPAARGDGGGRAVPRDDGHRDHPGHPAVRPAARPVSSSNS